MIPISKQNENILNNILYKDITDLVTISAYSNTNHTITYDFSNYITSSTNPKKQGIYIMSGIVGGVSETPFCLVLIYGYGFKQVILKGANMYDNVSITEKKITFSIADSITYLSNTKRNLRVIHLI